MRKNLMILLVLLLFTTTVAAEGVRKTIRFARGASSATIKGAVIRGEQDSYTLEAQAGQRMTVRITSLEKNAVFQIYQPNSEGALPGADEGDDATNWTGKLPSSGGYTIVVGGTRGNASYKLFVEIK
ncbi:MAG: hypothetical protein AB1757_02785 [Acidobacteriota bacterium]